MINGFRDVGTFLYSYGIDPTRKVFTMQDFLHLWLELTSEEVYDFSFATMGKDINKQAMREQGTNYTLTLMSSIDVVCHKCNTTVTTTPMKMMANKIEYGTWCSSCIRDIQRSNKAKLQEDMEKMQIESQYSGNDRNVDREYKMVQVVDQNGVPTGKVTMKKRTPEEIEEYDFNIQTKGSYRRNIEETGDPTGVNRPTYRSGVEDYNKEGFQKTGRTYSDI